MILILDLTWDKTSVKVTKWIRLETFPYSDLLVWNFTLKGSMGFSVKFEQLQNIQRNKLRLLINIKMLYMKTYSKMDQVKFVEDSI